MEKEDDQDDQPSDKAEWKWSAACSLSSLKPEPAAN